VQEIENVKLYNLDDCSLLLTETRGAAKERESGSKIVKKSSNSY